MYIGQETQEPQAVKKTKAKAKSIREMLRENRPEKVSIRLPIDKRKPEVLYVSVNGKRYSIQRGKTVDVPWAVAQVIEQSEKSDMDAQERMERLASAPLVTNL